jgi:hypothetical protein
MRRDASAGRTIRKALRVVRHFQTDLSHIADSKWLQKPFYRIFVLIFTRLGICVSISGVLS